MPALCAPHSQQSEMEFMIQYYYLVRAMVRGENGRSALLKAQGAEIAVADMSDAERIANALKDVQGAYYRSTPT
jgi:uncharacterized protein YbjT (DUF2867 family)